MRFRVEHQQLLLDICESNPELITNKFNGPDGKAKGHALWQSVTHKLNSLGFGEKSKEEWRKALIDWKCKTKAKASKIKQEICKTGGGPANNIPLSDLEKRLIAVMGPKAVDGDEVPELGFGKVTIIPVAPTKEMKENKVNNEHDYFEKENTYLHRCSMGYVPISTNTVSTESEASTSGSVAIKRKILSPNSKFNRRVTPKQTERLSLKLIDINQESLQLLNKISENTESIADSLKTMTEIMKKHLTNVKA